MNTFTNIMYSPSLMNRQKKPLVSIIIPAYNAQKYIVETIDSVIGQTFSNWELIIIDDGSTDDTKIIITPFLLDNRIKYVYQDNKGVSAARNHGYSLSNGRYLAFLDADDVWMPFRLTEMLPKLENKQIGLVHGYMRVIDENSKQGSDIYKGKEGNILDSLLLWDGCNIPAPSSILVKREVLEKVGGFDTDLSTAADQEFFFRVAKEYKIGMCKKVLGLYRIHGNNMHQNISHMEKDHLLTYQKAAQYNLFSSTQFKRKCFSNLYLILAGSWWVDGNNKFRGLYFLLKAILVYPMNIKKVLAKI